MSRYTIPPIDPQHTIVVGWDGPLETYFLQVTLAPARADEAPEVLEWEGATRQAITSVTALVLWTLPYGLIPIPVIEALGADARTSPPPSPLQRPLGGLCERDGAQ